MWDEQRSPWSRPRWSEGSEEPKVRSRSLCHCKADWEMWSSVCPGITGNTFWWTTPVFATVLCRNRIWSLSDPVQIQALLLASCVDLNELLNSSKLGASVSSAEWRGLVTPTPEDDWEMRWGKPQWYMVGIQYIVTIILPLIITFMRTMYLSFTDWLNA